MHNALSGESHDSTHLYVPPFPAALDAAANDDGVPPADPRDLVVAIAELVALAFRVRDEDALLDSLRRLVDAVDALEGAV